MTATESPGRISAVFVAAPTPVATAQPRRAICSGGRLVSTLITDQELQVIVGANVPRPAMVMMGSPVSLSPRCFMMAGPNDSHRYVRSRTQNQQAPQLGLGEPTTVSPGLSPRTSEPTVRTVPAPS